jgi:hypothetical protein
VVVLRPDRVVAAVCTPWALNRTLRELARRLHVDATRFALPTPIPLQEAA